MQTGGQSDVASIQATDHNPKFAATLATAFAQNYIAFRRDADRRKVRGTQPGNGRLRAALACAKQSDEGKSLQRQISRLSTLEALQTGNAELVQRATVPTSPSSPKTVRNTILAWILGLLLGVVLALLLERHDRRLRQPKEFEEAFGLPVLTEVLESKSLARSADRMGELLATQGDAFQMLRARLRYFNVDRDIHTVLVTSAGPGEGKTTIAWNIAAGAASAGVSTILVEADFHQPSVARRTRSGPDRASRSCSATRAAGRHRAAGDRGGPPERQGAGPAAESDRLWLSSSEPRGAAGERRDGRIRREAQRQP